MSAMYLTSPTYAYVYKWTELSTGRWYIGSRTKHGCTPADGYICSSRIVKPLIESNQTNWIRTVLCIGHAVDMLALETALLTLVDAKNDPLSYNQHNGDGKFSTAGVAPWNKGAGCPRNAPAWNRGLTKDNNLSMAKISAKRQGQPANNKGKPMSDEQKLKMVAIHNNRSDETCKKISDALTGKAQTAESNAKRSATLKGRGSHRKGKIVGPYKKREPK